MNLDEIIREELRATATAGEPDAANRPDRGILNPWEIKITGIAKPRSRRRRKTTL
jgi:hypothetical protein